MNAFEQIQKRGQSIWFDHIRRAFVESGELQELVEHDGLAGVTSNPSIFQKAIAGSTDYDEAIRRLAGERLSAKQVYERLAIDDIRMAADVLRPVYDRTRGGDGFVSLEVSPYLAADSPATLAEAKRLHAAIGRDNVMIKVPATTTGVDAIRALAAAGIPINVTLLFSVDTYLEVARAWMEGLETRVAQGSDITRVASVASFFVSRIDSLVDQMVGAELDATRDAGRRARLKSVVGRVAIANAVLAYAASKALQATPQWRSLAGNGARAQRLLWASTSAKNPKYSPTVYVETLVANGTVNTLPSATYQAVRRLESVRAPIVEDWDATLGAARATMQALEDAGISMHEVAATLLDEAVAKFSDAFDALLGVVENKRQAVLKDAPAKQSWSLGAATESVEQAMEEWRQQGRVRRLWRSDPTLWTGHDEARWLGWLHVVDDQRDHDDALRHIRDDVHDAAFRHVLLLGMGGSSLCPEVMARTFGRIPGSPELLVLDSTVPAHIRRIEKRIDPARTLFIVASKSGTTTEPNAFKDYFFARVGEAVGHEHAGARFIAITDPGTRLHVLAKHDHFRHVVHGVPDIGGRYSALSNFGMVPAAVSGVPIDEFLDRTETMVLSCGSCVPPAANPGVALGIALGSLAQQGRDKLTLVTSPAIGVLGAWLEQLVAESTGKEGCGLIPIDGETLTHADAYSRDRIFVYTRLAAAPDIAQDVATHELERAGHPVIRIDVDETMNLGQEFFRWEIATAVAGAVLGINAFDQPDVEASKVATRRLSTEYESSGRLPDERPILREGEISLFADAANAAALHAAAATSSVDALFRAHLDRLTPGDYFAINAYIDMNESHIRELQTMRHRVRERHRVATTVGFGPRFLHSTGQLHKGGPPTGVFLQITSEDAEDISIPGWASSFGILKRFQAQGDFEVLAERGRRLLRVHLGQDGAGLEQLRRIVERATA